MVAPAMAFQETCTPVMKKTAVVILNWNGKEMLEKYLPSVVQYSSLPGIEVIVADNGSADDSMLFLAEKYPEVRTIRLDKNYGFAAGYNNALEQVEADYYILLNSDVEVTEGWITPMTNLLDNEPDVAACMPKILSYERKNYFEYAGASGGFIDRFGYAFCRGRIFDHLEEDHGQYDEPMDIFWATGACLCIRAKVFHRAGGFDERFFAHMEEIDLCWRLQNAGYRIMVIPKSFVYHYGGGALPPENPYKTYLNFRNNLLMLFKNLKLFQIFTIFQFRILLDWLSVFKFLFSRRFQHAWAVIKAHLMFLLWMPSSIGRRYKIKSRMKMQDLKGSYSKSIVRDFFLLNIMQFSELEGKFRL